MPETRGRPFEVERDGVRIVGEEAGDGPAIVCLHGITATRWYVLTGSRRLERHGYRVVTFDARGHGESSAAPERSAYSYDDFNADLEAVLDDRGIERAVLVGNSLGAHTAASYALARPDRVAGLVLVTPRYEGHVVGEASDVVDWDELADALETDGIQGFLGIWGPLIGGRWKKTVMMFTRQRLERHNDLRAVADSVRILPRVRPFERMEDLETVQPPALVVGSHDGPDPGHPLRVAKLWAKLLPGSELAVEEDGKPPIAWQGAELSRLIQDFLERRVSGWESRPQEAATPQS